MNIEQAGTVIKKIAENKTPLSVILWGKHGLAKTAMIEKIASDLNYDFEHLILSQREPTDLLGVFHEKHDSDLNMTVTDYYPPTWFAKAVKKGKMIIFLDELNRASRDVIKASFTLINERRLNNLKIKDDVLIIAACNPSSNNDEEDSSYDVEVFDDALNDRFMHLFIKPDSNIWLNWAEKNIDPSIQDFIKSMPEALFFKTRHEHSFPIKIKQSGRSWHRVSYVRSLKLPEALEYECIEGCVGPELAKAYKVFLERTDKPLSADEIITLNKASLAKINSWKNDPIRLDLFKESSNNLRIYLEKSKEKALEYKENILTFMFHLPGDQLHPLLSLIMNNNSLAFWATEVMNNKPLLDKLNNLSALMKNSRLIQDEKKRK